MRALLMKNHGVGIMGGYYEEGLPVCMCSELLVEMLGYASGEEFHALAGGLVNIICPRGNKVFTEEEFKNWAGPMERYMRTREGGALGVRIVKEDQKRSDGVVMWLASVCNMHEVFQAEKEILQMNTKLESGETVLFEEAFNLEEMLTQCTEIIFSQAQEKNIHILSHNHAEIPCPHVIGSPVHVSQILTNILSNAVKYNRRGGSVWLDVREKSRTDDKVWMEFRIEDNGIGMSPEFQEKMFEPFTQEGRKSGYGTGLGMSIIKKLTEKMDGTIQVTSQKEVGTTFTVVLPFLIDHNPKAAESETQSNRDTLEEKRILLVEDNALNQEIAKFMLEEAGAVVDTADDGAEAVKKATDSPDKVYDVILMDIMMPEMDGYEATRAIRAAEQKENRHTPIIAMTANAFVEDIEKCKAAGMDDHIPKPLDVNRVMSVIGRYVGR